MTWEPFVLALVLGLVVSAGLYFAYLWPAVAPDDETADAESLDPPTVAPGADPEAPDATRPPAPVPTTPGGAELAS